MAHHTEIGETGQVDCIPTGFHVLIFMRPEWACGGEWNFAEVVVERDGAAVALHTTRQILLPSFRYSVRRKGQSCARTHTHTCLFIRCHASA